MKVKLKKDINIKDLAENYWEGCQTWTLDFIKNYYGDNITFKAKEVIEGSYRIYGTGINTDKDNEDLDYIEVNKKCFDIIEEDPEDEEIKEHHDIFDYFTGYSFGETNKELLQQLEHNFQIVNEELDYLINKINKD